MFPAFNEIFDMADYPKLRIFFDVLSEIEQ